MNDSGRLFICFIRLLFFYGDESRCEMARQSSNAKGARLRRGDKRENLFPTFFPFSFMVTLLAKYGALGVFNRLHPTR